MAMLEKPKKKKKKVKTSEEVENAVAAVDGDSPNLALVDDDLTSLEDIMLSSTISNISLADIDKIETVTATNTKHSALSTTSAVEMGTTGSKSELLDNNGTTVCTNDKVSISESSGVVDENTVSEQSAPDMSLLDPSESVQVCSAPPIELTETIAIEPPAPEYAISKESEKIFYPDLSSLKINQDKILEGNTIEYHMAKMIPFTDDQLKILYINESIELTKSFETEFINTELRGDYCNHYLYTLLTKYAKCRYNVNINATQVSQVTERLSEHDDNLWTIVNQTMRVNGTCDDGVSVSAVKRFEKAELNDNVYEKMSQDLAELHSLLCFEHTLFIYQAESTRLEIEQIIRSILNSCSEFQNIHNETSVGLRADPKPELSRYYGDLRLAISILFAFVRKHSPDKVFSRQLRCWLQQLVALHLRLATWQDHLFLLFHILRCPAGVGTWATQFISLPKPVHQSDVYPLADQRINHCMTILSVLLTTINNRNDFLKLRDKNCQDASNEESWIIVDSEGEENHTIDGNCVGLKEDDLVAILNQIPFEEFFALIVNAKKEYDIYTLNESQITNHYMLKFIAFSSRFIELISNGLVVYSADKYRQFAKRLARLIRHVVLYVTDMFSIFQSKCGDIDIESQARIVLEYNTFVLRACYYVYKTRCLGTWQYLATLPFNRLQIKTIWRIYYYLNIGFPTDFIASNIRDCEEKVKQPDFHSNFFGLYHEINNEDFYYLLQTFSTMALSVTDENMQFKEEVTLFLLEIGYLSEITKEICYKMCRDLLINLTLQHPNLIAKLLFVIRENFNEIGKNCLYLFGALPLDHWHPKMTDFEVLAGWVLNNSFESIESALSRSIFSRLNWNFDENGDLFISHDIHIRMACLVLEIAQKHVPEVVGAGTITESMRHMSSLVKNQTARDKFINWCWNMIAVLRLHAMDLDRQSVLEFMRNTAPCLHIIPELDKFDSVKQGVVDNRPLAIYCSLLMTLNGHSIPQICQYGFDLILKLITDCRHSIVIRSLQLIVPLFLDCPESLSQCEKFQQVLTQLINADRTYMKMAKEFITTDDRGPVMEYFGNMLQCQVINYANIGLSSPSLLINLWINCLTHYQGWTKETNILYLLDLLLKIAYQFPDAWFNSKEYFRFIYTKSQEPRLTKSSSFFSLFGDKQSSGLIPTPSGDIVWLSLLNLELEHEIFESHTRIWPELLRELKNVNGKFTMDTIIKKIANTLECPSFSANHLILYKYATLITTCSQNSALLPILCQRFFELYLYRIPLSVDEERFTEIYGVADKFYESDIPLMKRVKKSLQDAAHLYKEKSLVATNEALAQIYNGLTKLFHSFSLWLEETQINRIKDLRQSQLPPQFDLNRLAIIFAKDGQYWNEFIYFPHIRDEQREASNNWLKYFFRYTTSSPRPNRHNASGIGSIENPQESILRHLKSYDDPKSPPRLNKEPVLFNDLSKERNMQRFLNIIQKDFRKLEITAKEFCLVAQEVNALNNEFKDLQKYLYKNEMRNEVIRVECQKLLQSNCSGAAAIRFMMNRVIRTEIVEAKIHANRKRYWDLVNQKLLQHNESTVLSLLRIVYYVDSFVKEYEFLKLDSKKPAFEQLVSVAIEFFYETVNGISEPVSTYPPTNELCSKIFVKLKPIVIDNQEAEGLSLLKTALNRPDLIEMLSELFAPAQTRPMYFLEMYKFLLGSHRKECNMTVVVVLLSKFEFKSWWTLFKPKLSEISELIKLITLGLEHWSKSDSNVIHDALRQHLILTLEYNFPENFGDVLHNILEKISEQKLKPIILCDLINSLYKLANLPENTLLDSNSCFDINQIKDFAGNQRILTYQDLTDSVIMLAGHFRNERLQHGLHGLYPQHKDYCNPLNQLFSTLLHSVVISTVHNFPGMLSINALQKLWPLFSDLYYPWLVPYYPHAMDSSPANWIKLASSSNPILLPWSKIHATDAQIMINGFIDIIGMFLQTFVVNNEILGYVFYWYATNFANSVVPQYVLQPIHASLVKLDWKRFIPDWIHIQSLHQIVQQFLPECHTFCGYIFLQIPWNEYIAKYVINATPLDQQTVMGSLLSIFIRISYEPHIKDNPRLHSLLSAAVEYPWHVITYLDLEPVLDWIILSIESSMVLKLESNKIDNELISILKKASSTIPNESTILSSSLNQSKRILYARSIVRQLKSCVSKYPTLIASKQGQIAFDQSIAELLDLLQKIVGSIENTSDGLREAIDLNIEITQSMQMQNELTTKMFVNAIIKWQSTVRGDSIMVLAMLNAYGHNKTVNPYLTLLLESTIEKTFAANGLVEKNMTWEKCVSHVGPALPTVDLNHMVKQETFLTIHIYALNKLKQLENLGDKISYLQSIHRQIEGLKIMETNEPKLMLLWSLIISFGYQSKDTESSKRQLLTLARYFQMTSNHVESWSGGILEVIGFKKDGISNRRRVVMKLLACLVFGLFDEQSEGGPIRCREFEHCVTETKTLLNHKRYVELRSEGLMLLDNLEYNVFPTNESTDFNNIIGKILQTLFDRYYLHTISDVWNFK